MDHPSIFDFSGWPPITSMVLHAMAFLVLALVTDASRPAQQTNSLNELNLMVDALPEVERETLQDFALEEPIPAPQPLDTSGLEPESVTMPMAVAVTMAIAGDQVNSVDVGATSSEVGDSLGDGIGEMFSSETLSSEMFADVDALASTASGPNMLFGTVETSEAARTRVAQPDGLVGKFYDFKQDRERRKLPYSGAFPDYIRIVNTLADGGFKDAVTKDYYLADTQLILTHILIPANTSANDGPKAFLVEDEVQPSGWLVHYTATVTPPKNGEYRFVGFFDDLLIVYINNQPVLDGSWVPMCNVGRGPYDNSLRQEFGGPGVSGDRTAYAGKWVDIKGPTKIDILIGETPGGLVGGLLMVQKKGETYESRADGAPILPLFATSALGLNRIQQEPFAQAYGLVKNPPIWATKNKKR